MPRPKPVPPPRPHNPIRNQREIRAPTPLIRKAAANAASRPAKRLCPNKECSTPKIEDGICHNCGAVIDEANIVSEISFGENSSGAAVVQGSFVGEGQGSAHSLGPAFKKVGGGGESDRESTVREGKRLMQALANQLRISEQVVNNGVQIFKLAAMANFIQGRRMEHVASVCLYSACRKERPCNVMLIDFADKVQVNVFKLGHTFKSLHKAVTLAKDGIMPVLPEDLIYRFAMKLEFGSMTTQVATDAVRMVQRMSIDWMVMGRRPSGVCGACLILAARMNNFRRTITEVVYIVKVTTHTIQKRLDEFKLTPSSALTVEEFLNNEFLESAHDPPSFYEKQDEFIKNKKTRKRKRIGHDATQNEEDENEEGDADERNVRRKTATPNPDEALAAVELRRDADGFAIPPPPTQTQPQIPIDPDLVDDAIEDRAGTSFDELVKAFGDELDPESDEDDAGSTASSSSPKRRGRKPDRSINVPEEWTRDEDALEDQISEMVSDPNTRSHAISYARAVKRSQRYIQLLEDTNPSKEISMDVHIGDDEFADDPEVNNCVLSPEDVAKKEKVWVNANKEWLRREQLKAYQKKIAERGPPKATRNRKKKPRIGEGQTAAASSPADAAVNVLKERTWSKKINYDRIRELFPEKRNKGSMGSALGSAATSRVTSRAGSTLGDSESADASSASGDDRSSAGDATPRAVEEDDDEEGDEDDYVHDTATDAASAVPPPVDETEEQDDWKKTMREGREGMDEDFDEGEDEDFALGNGDIDDDTFDGGVDDDWE